MKKLLKTLVFIPVIALSACASLGKEADETAVQAYVAEIEKVEEPKNLTFSVEMSGTQIQANARASYKVVLKTKKAENGDVYTYVYEKQPGMEAKIEYYQVKNEKYEEITYVSTRISGREPIYQVFAKKDNPEYATLIEDAEEEFEYAAETYYDLLGTPEGALDSVEGNKENMTIKYYSNGEKNLSVKLTYKDGKPEAGQENDEYMVSAALTATYNDYRLSSANSSAKSNIGSSNYLKASASYGKVSINLPSGWENLLNKAAR